MLKSLLKIIRGDGPPIERLRLSEQQLLADRAEAVAAFEVAKAAMSAAAGAMANGDPGAIPMADKARAAQAAARQRLADIDDTTDALRRQIKAEEARQSAAGIESRWKRTEEGCARRVAAAERLQQALIEAGAAWREMQAETAEIGHVVPVARPWALLNEWDARVRAVSEGQLKVSSAGGLGDRDALGIFTLPEHSRRLASGEADTVVRAVERQHRQLLKERAHAQRSPEPTAA